MLAEQVERIGERVAAIVADVVVREHRDVAAGGFEKADIARSANDIRSALVYRRADSLGRERALEVHNTQIGGTKYIAHRREYPLCGFTVDLRLNLKADVAAEQYL